ncbi:hypothetical protein V4C85_02310 [Ralstonia solanacearum]|uniref:hypothetical protein n=1 Tax=Ralstonia solanacearum TaxID=305 RepID=UPI0007C8FBF3|nr:hypothetical protein [Ralstonia solanacearum]OAI76924.1 hypothetical protein RSP597_06475 [Ralstonia solanacearum]
MASTKRLNATITLGGTVTGALKAALTGTTKSLEAMGQTIRNLDKQQKLLGRTIQEFGRAGKSVDGMRARYASLAEQLDRTRKAQERLATAQARSTKAVAFVKGAGTAVAVGAGAAGLAARPLLKSAIERENSEIAIRNSGVSKEEADAMIDAAKNSRQFGVSLTEAAKTVGELRTALGDAHHAIEALPTALKAISGLQLYDRLHHTDLASGSSAQNLAKIADELGGAQSVEALAAKQNWAFRAITGSNGVITPDRLLTSVRAGKGAVRAMNDEAFFGDTFLQNSMGADRYGTSSSTLVNAWIGGHQTHSAFDHMMQQGLLNRSGVKFDKTGKVKTISPDALVDAQTFLKDPQKWVDQHLVPLAKKQGVDVNDPEAVMKFVSAIASNPNAASMLMNRILSRDAIWRDRRNVVQANGIDASDQANKNSSAGKQQNARARLDDAEERMGRALLPALNRGLEMAATALESLNKFAEQSPRAFQACTWGIVGLTGAVASLATAGLAKTAVTGLAGALGSGAGGLGSAIAALANPVGIAVVALGTLAAAAYAFRPISKAEVDAAKTDGGARLTPAAQARVDAGELNRPAALPNVPPMASARLPVVPPMLAARGSAAGATAPVTNNYAVTVNAPAGVDAKEIGRIAVEELRRQEGIAMRGRMYDRAGDH